MELLGFVRQQAKLRDLEQKEGLYWKTCYERLSNKIEKKPQPRVFLFMEHRFRLAVYCQMFSLMGCRVQGATTVQRAVQYIAPQIRSEDEPCYDLVVIDKEDESLTTLADVVRWVRESDERYQREFGIVTYTKIISICGADIHADRQFTAGVDLYLRRPLLPYLDIIRQLIIPVALMSHRRARLLRLQGRFRDILDNFDHHPEGPEDDTDEPALHDKFTYTELEDKVTYLNDCVDIRDRELKQLRYELRESKKANDALESELGSERFQHDDDLKKKQQEIESLQRMLSAAQSVATNLQNARERSLMRKLEQSERTATRSKEPSASQGSGGADEAGDALDNEYVSGLQMQLEIAMNTTNTLRKEVNYLTDRLRKVEAGGKTSRGVQCEIIDPVAIARRRGSAAPPVQPQDIMSSIVHELPKSVVDELITAGKINLDEQLQRLMESQGLTASGREQQQLDSRGADQRPSATSNASSPELKPFTPLNLSGPATTPSGPTDKEVTLERDLKRMQAEKRDLEKKNSQLEYKLRIETEHKELGDPVNDSAAERIDELQGELQMQKDVLEEQKKTFEHNVKTLNTKISAIRGENSKYEEELDSTMAELRAAKAEIEKVKDDVLQAEGEAAKWKQAKDAESKQREAEKQQFNALQQRRKKEDKSAEKDDEIRSLKTTVERLESELADSQSFLVVTKRDLGDERRKVAESEQRIDSLKIDIEEMAATAKGQQQRLTKLLKEKQQQQAAAGKSMPRQSSMADEHDDEETQTEPVEMVDQAVQKDAEDGGIEGEEKGKEAISEPSAVVPVDQLHRAKSALAQSGRVVKAIEIQLEYYRGLCAQHDITLFEQSHAYAQLLQRQQELEDRRLENGSFVGSDDDDDVDALASTLRTMFHSFTLSSSRRVPTNDHSRRQSVATDTDDTSIPTPAAPSIPTPAAPSIPTAAQGDNTMTDVPSPLEVNIAKPKSSDRAPVRSVLVCETPEPQFEGSTATSNTPLQKSNSTAQNSSAAPVKRPTAESGCQSESVVESNALELLLQKIDSTVAITGQLLSDELADERDAVQERAARFNVSEELALGQSWFVRAAIESLTVMSAFAEQCETAINEERAEAEATFARLEKTHTEVLKEERAQFASQLAERSQQISERDAEIADRDEKLSRSMMLVEQEIAAFQASASALETAPRGSVNDTCPEGKEPQVAVVTEAEKALEVLPRVDSNDATSQCDAPQPTELRSPPGEGGVEPIELNSLVRARRNSLAMLLRDTTPTASIALQTEDVEVFRHPSATASIGVQVEVVPKQSESTDAANTGTQKQGQSKATSGRQSEVKKNTSPRRQSTTSQLVVCAECEKKLAEGEAVARPNGTRRASVVSRRGSTTTVTAGRKGSNTSSLTQATTEVSAALPAETRAPVTLTSVGIQVDVAPRPHRRPSLREAATMPTSLQDKDASCIAAEEEELHVRSNLSGAGVVETSTTATPLTVSRRESDCIPTTAGESQPRNDAVPLEERLMPDSCSIAVNTEPVRFADDPPAEEAAAPTSTSFLVPAQVATAVVKAKRRFQGRRDEMASDSSPSPRRNDMSVGGAVKPTNTVMQSTASQRTKKLLTGKKMKNQWTDPMPQPKMIHKGMSAKALMVDAGTQVLVTYQDSDAGQTPQLTLLQTLSPASRENDDILRPSLLPMIVNSALQLRQKIIAVMDTMFNNSAIRNDFKWMAVEHAKNIFGGNRPAGANKEKLMQAFFTPMSPKDVKTVSGLGDALSKDAALLSLTATAIQHHVCKAGPSAGAPVADNNGRSGDTAVDQAARTKYLSEPTSGAPRRYSHGLPPILGSTPSILSPNRAASKARLTGAGGRLLAVSEGEEAPRSTLDNADGKPVESLLDPVVELEASMMPWNEDDQRRQLPPLKMGAAGDPNNGAPVDDGQTPLMFGGAAQKKRNKKRSPLRKKTKEPIKHHVVRAASGPVNLGIQNSGVQ